MKGEGVWKQASYLMGNKITRKDASSLLVSYMGEMYNTIMGSGLVNPKKFITCRTYVDKGQRVEEYYCQNCGSIHTNIRKTGYYGHYSATCPSCGNDNYAGGSKTIESNERVLFVEPIEDGFKFAVYKTKHYFDTLDSKWWLTDATPTIIMYYVGRFDKENGWYVYSNSEKKILARGCNLECDILKFVKGATPVNKFDGNYSVMIAEATAYEAKKNAANLAKKANSKTTLLEEMRSNYKPKEVLSSDIANVAHGIMYEVYSTKDDKTTLLACCTKCKTTFRIEKEDDGTMCQIKCPSCNESGEAIYNSYSYNYGYRNNKTVVAVFENTNLPENDLLVRVFELDRSFNVDSGYKENVAERQRIFFGKKVNVYTRSYDYRTKSYGPFKKATVRDIDSCLSGWRTDGKIIQTGDEIAKIIRNSCLMYSGLVEAYGFGDKRYKSCEEAPSMNYLMAWYKNPAIELVLKSNMTTIIDHMINEPAHLGSGNTLADALGVSPTVAKIAAKLNLDYASLTDLAALHRANPNLTAEEFLEIKQLNLPTHQLAQLKTQYNVDYKQTMKYLDAVYNHQCIERREALTQWVDYLRMATALRIDLTDKSRMYPGSLKKEHDVATFAYKAIQIEVDKEKFAQQAEQNAYFEYSYKDLIVVVPKSPQDIVEEATRQKNCLRSYVEQVKNGSTVVAFIRRKIMPDATYVTAEVRDGRLIQLKGYCNSNPRNKELVEFVQHWSKAKGIRVEC